MAYFRINFLTQGNTQEYPESSGNFYRLNDGREIPLSRHPVWCDACGEVTDGERIEPIDEIEAGIQKYERLAVEIRREMALPPTPSPNAPGERAALSEIAKLQFRASWRRERKSPPRCLRCGSTQIIKLSEVPIETRVGKISMTFIGFIDTFKSYGKFTPEGERITD